MSDIPEHFTGTYYDEDYFKTPKGKKYKDVKGDIHGWSYENPDGEWLGAGYIAKAWKTVFDPKNLLDIGAGRGTFIAYARDSGIEAEGFDYSHWAVDEGRYQRCKAGWLKWHDATKPWPYRDNSFELGVALDFYEHIYEPDIDFVMSEMSRVSSKYIFLEIAVTGSGGLQGEGEGYILKKGKPVPEGLEGCAVAGHVTVCSENWWLDRLDNYDWFRRRDMETHFVSLCPPSVLANWVQNAIIIMEKM